MRVKGLSIEGNVTLKQEVINPSWVILVSSHQATSWQTASTRKSPECPNLHVGGASTVASVVSFKMKWEFFSKPVRRVLPLDSDFCLHGGSAQSPTSTSENHWQSKPDSFIWRVSSSTFNHKGGGGYRCKNDLTCWFCFAFFFNLTVWFANV